jgi:hypothetical protein
MMAKFTTGLSATVPETDTIVTLKDVEAVIEVQFAT